MLAPVNKINERTAGRGYPVLSLESSRETLIRWLCRCDPHGCYTDEQSQAEGLPPLSLTEAWDLVLDAGWLHD